MTLRKKYIFLPKNDVISQNDVHYDFKSDVVCHVDFAEF